ncbi:MAG: endonuclease V [Deltaproteobacteria bacterium]|nr:endonuclease V [Deltaproteobacteria bacterium]
MELHSWTLSAKEAISLQKTLAEQVLIQPLPARLKILGAEDLSYSKHSDLLFAVILTFKWPGLDLIESVHHVCKASFPYVPGLLSFREVPPLIEAYGKLGQKPDVLLCDAQGIAHPRKLGLAAHLGLCLGIPTVGCAKSRLCGTHDDPPLKKGSSRPLMLDGEQVGIVFRSRDGVKPIYISPGHLADVQSSKKLVYRCLRRYRIPEPLRLAHIEANRRRMEIEEESKVQSQKANVKT